MARVYKCKCKLCGKSLTTDVAFNFPKIDKNGKKKNQYYCSEEEYREHEKNTELLRENQILFDKIIGYTCINNIKNKEFAKIYDVGYSRRQVNKFLLDKGEYIKGSLDKKLANGDMNEYQKILYIFAIIRSEIKDYFSKSDRPIKDTTEYEDVGSNIEVETEVKKPIVKKKKVKRGLMDIL